MTDNKKRKSPIELSNFRVFELLSMCLLCQIEKKRFSQFICYYYITRTFIGNEDWQREKEARCLKTAAWRRDLGEARYELGFTNRVGRSHDPDCLHGLKSRRLIRLHVWATTQAPATDTVRPQSQVQVLGVKDNGRQFG